LKETLEHNPSKILLIAQLFNSNKLFNSIDNSQNKIVILAANNTILSPLDNNTETIIPTNSSKINYITIIIITIIIVVLTAIVVILFSMKQLRKFYNSNQQQDQQQELQNFNDKKLYLNGTSNLKPENGGTIDEQQEKLLNKKQSLT
jgi:hypothetical protein